MYNMVNTYIICPECGDAYILREEPEVIKSNTETYIYLCPDCGFVHTAKSDEDMKEWAERKIEAKDESTKPIVDMVNHPSHYTSGTIECIDAMIETQGIEAVKSYCKCNAFKYLWRHSFKNGEEDIDKARWYLNEYVKLRDSGTDELEDEK